MSNLSSKRASIPEPEKPLDKKVEAEVAQSEVPASKENQMEELMQMNPDTMTAVTEEKECDQLVKEITNDAQHLSIDEEKAVQVEAAAETKGESFILILTSISCIRSSTG